MLHKIHVLSNLAFCFAGFLNIGRWPKGKPRLANFGLMDQVAGKLISTVYFLFIRITL